MFSMNFWFVIDRNTTKKKNRMLSAVSLSIIKIEVLFFVCDNGHCRFANQDAVCKLQLQKNRMNSRRKKKRKQIKTKAPKRFRWTSEKTYDWRMLETVIGAKTKITKVNEMYTELIIHRWSLEYLRNARIVMVNWNGQFCLQKRLVCLPIARCYRITCWARLLCIQRAMPP